LGELSALPLEEQRDEDRAAEDELRHARERLDQGRAHGVLGLEEVLLERQAVLGLVELHRRRHQLVGLSPHRLGLRHRARPHGRTEACQPADHSQRRHDQQDERAPTRQVSRVQPDEIGGPEPHQDRDPRGDPQPDDRLRVEASTPQPGLHRRNKADKPHRRLQP
jgi:hypothetical protein